MADVGAERSDAVDDGVIEAGSDLFENYAPAALVHAVDRALDCYARPPAWRRLMANAMAQDPGRACGQASQHDPSRRAEAALARRLAG